MKNEIFEFTVKVDRNVIGMCFADSIDTLTNDFTITLGEHLPNLHPDVIKSFFDNIPRVRKFKLPESIPTVAAPLIAYILSSGVDIEYYKEETTMDQLNEPNPGFHKLTVDEIPTPVPTNVPPKDILPFIDDGFTPIDESNPFEPNDGFHEIPVKDDDDKPSPIERRFLKMNDPERMNRLSYAPIAAMRGETSYPAEVGGGQIPRGLLSGAR